MATEFLVVQAKSPFRTMPMVLLSPPGYFSRFCSYQPLAGSPQINLCDHSGFCHRQYLNGHITSLHFKVHFITASLFVLQWVKWLDAQRTFSLLLPKWAVISPTFWVLLELVALRIMFVFVLAFWSVYKVKISLADSEYELWATLPGTPGEASSQGPICSVLDPRVRSVPLCASISWSTYVTCNGPSNVSCVFFHWKKNWHIHWLIRVHSNQYQ